MFPFATLYQFFSCLIWNEENAVVIKKREFISKLKKKQKYDSGFIFILKKKKLFRLMHTLHFFLQLTFQWIHLIQFFSIQLMRTDVCWYHSSSSSRLLLLFMLFVFSFLMITITTTADAQYSFIHFHFGSYSLSFPLSHTHTHTFPSSTLQISFSSWFVRGEHSLMNVYKKWCIPN